MRKLALVLSITLALGIVLILVFRDQLQEVASDAVTADMFVDADTDAFDPGPAVGSTFPGVQAIYQGERITSIRPFAGSRGTMLMASRSFDWCPYCMRQMIELNKVADAYAAAGIGLVVITYDTPEQLQAFAAEHNIRVPLLSDVNALTFKTLGILNSDYAPGDRAFGIPYPGMLVIDPAGIVVGKLFLEPYQKRIDAMAALDYARGALSTAADSRMATVTSQPQ